MSKHIGRNQRWSRRDAKTYMAQIGRVLYRQDAWYAELVYRIRESLPNGEALPIRRPHSRWLGPYRRPRNAMIELEREVAVLRNRHGDELLIGSETNSA